MQLSSLDCSDGARDQRAGASLDWPLSRDEKKSCVLKLYDRDVRAANNLLRSGEAALEALRQELAVVRNAGGALDDGIPSSPRGDLCHAANLDTPRESYCAGPTTPERRRVPALKASTAAAIAAAAVEISPPPSTGALAPMTHCRAATTTSEQEVAAEAAERLHLAITNAAAALRVLWGSAADDDCNSLEVEDDLGRMRARSEGALRLKESAPAGLRRDGRRHSRGGDGRRVSFADEAATHKGADSDGSPPPLPSRSSISEPEPEVPLTPERRPATPRARRPTSPKPRDRGDALKTGERPIATGKVPASAGLRLSIAPGGGVALPGATGHCPTPRAKAAAQPFRFAPAPARRLPAVQDAPRCQAVLAPAGVMDFL